MSNKMPNSLKQFFPYVGQIAKNILPSLAVLTQSRYDSGVTKKRCLKGFPCGESCQQKGRKCENPDEGQFSTYSDYIDNTVAHFASTSKGIAEIQGYLAVTRSIARNTSTKGRQQAVIRLYKQAQNDEQLHALLEKIDFQSVVTNPKHFVTESSKIHFTKDIAGKVTLKFTLSTPALKPSKDLRGDELDKVTAVSPDEVAALAVAQEYKKTVENINNLIETLNSKKDFTDSEYKKYFAEINKQFDGLASLKDDAKKLKMVLNETVKEYIDKASNVNKENLPGFQLEVPVNLDRLSDKVVHRPC